MSSWWRYKLDYLFNLIKISVSKTWHENRYIVRWDGKVCKKCYKKFDEDNIKALFFLQGNIFIQATSR